MIDAATIAANIESATDYTARIWEGDTCTRVYVSRDLSRGRTQDMGYIEIAEDGSAHGGGLQRNRAGIESAAGLRA